MKVVSVLWHSVEPDSINPEFVTGLNPTASLFRQQIELLVSRYTPVSIREFLEIQKGSALPGSYKKPPILLTFDDGFKNVVDQALPVLNEFGVPAMFFVIAEIIQNPDFVPWYVECIHMLRRTPKKSATYGNVSLDLTSQKDRARVLELLEVCLRKCRRDHDRQKVLSDLAALLEINRPTASDLDSDLRFVSSEDLARLGTSSLLTVASHSMTHRFLDTLTDAEQQHELQQSHLLLSRCSPSYFPAFAYPGGAFNSTTVELTRRIYNCAFAVCFGASYKNSYAYPRIGVGQDTGEQLAYAISATRIAYVIPVKRFLHFTRIRKWA